MGTLYILGISLIYSILLICIYFYKQRLNNLENKLFISLMLTNFIGLVLDILSIFTVSNMNYFPVLNSIITKTYLVYLFTWATLFTCYVFVISKSEKTIKTEFNNKKIFVLFYLLIVTIIYILPLYYQYDSKGMYSYGLSANLLYVIIFIYIVIWLIQICKNYKKLKSKKYLPIFVFIVFGFIVMVIQKLNPYLLLMTSMETFVTFLMYFTIENPDLQMLRDFNKSKENIEKTNNEKTMFLLNISQQMKKPLKTIEKRCEIILDCDDINLIKEDVREISRSSKFLLNSINNVLDTSDMDKTQLKIYNTKYNTKVVFKEIIATNKMKLQNNNIEFRTNISEDIPNYLYGDSAHLKQVIDVILNNAISYTSSGYIELNISCIIKQDICRLILEVEDSGVGMDANTIESIFSDSKKSLSQAKRIISNLDGTIMVSSEPKKGSKFTVVLDQKIVNNEKNALEKLTQNYISNINVLVISSVKRDINAITKVTKEYNGSIDVVDLGIKGLEKVHKSSNYKLIFIDEKIPKLTAQETLDKLKQYENIKMPVIILTSSKQNETKKLYLKNGFSSCLEKPVNKEEVKMIFKKYIED